jgi:hypothetical protein
MRKNTTTFAIILHLSAVGAVNAQAEKSKPSTVPASTQPTEPAPRVIYLPAEQAGFGRSGVYVPTPIPADVVQQVSVVLQVDGSMGDDGYNRVDTSSIASLLGSTAVIDSAVKSVLKVTPTQRREIVIVNSQPAGNRYTRLEVALRKTDQVELPPDAAEKVLAALTDRLKAALQESANAARSVQQAREGDLQKQMEGARGRLQEARTKSRETRDALSKLSVEISNNDPQYVIRNTRQQRNQVEAELNRSKARLAALEPASGPLSAEWEEVVKIRTQRLDDAKKTDNKADIAEAQAKLAEAKAQLASIKRAAEGSDANRSNNRSEASQIRVQIAEQEARLKPLAEAMEKLEDPKFVDLLEQQPELQAQEQRARTEINEIQNRLDNFRRIAQMDPRIVITVLDGEPDAK